MNAEPQPPSPRKNWFRRHKITTAFWVLAVLLVVLALAWP